MFKMIKNYMRIDNPDFFCILGRFSLLTSLFKNVQNSQFNCQTNSWYDTFQCCSQWRLCLDESCLRLSFSPSSLVSQESIWPSGSYLLHSDEQMQMATDAVLSCCCRWAAPLSSRCTSNIQPERMLFTCRGGSWVELQGWKRSTDASRRSSSADAAQSHSWRWYSWHKTRWLCLGSGALRRKEEWSDEVLQFLFH